VTDDRGPRGSSDEAPTQVVQVPGSAGRPAGTGAGSDAEPEQGSVRVSDQRATSGNEPTAAFTQPGAPRAVPVRPAAGTRPPVRAEQRGAARAPARRRARLALRRVDPWSVFLLSFLVSVFLAFVLVVAVLVLYTLLDALGVLNSIDTFARDLEIVDPDQSLLGLGRVLGITAAIALVDIVLLTVLATLGAFLYNLCAALTGGVEVVLVERD